VRVFSRRGVGNLLVIVVVLASARMRTVTNYFIANLSIADVMIGCLSIPFQFQAALLQRWDLPEIKRFLFDTSISKNICQKCDE